MRSFRGPTKMFTPQQQQQKLGSILDLTAIAAGKKRSAWDVKFPEEVYPGGERQASLLLIFCRDSQLCPHIEGRIRQPSCLNSAKNNCAGFCIFCVYFVIFGGKTQLGENRKKRSRGCQVFSTRDTRITDIQNLPETVSFPIFLTEICIYFPLSFLKKEIRYIKDGHYTYTSSKRSGNNGTCKRILCHGQTAQPGGSVLGIWDPQEGGQTSPVWWGGKGGIFCIFAP